MLSSQTLVFSTGFTAFTLNLGACPHWMHASLNVCFRLSRCSVATIRHTARPSLKVKSPRGQASAWWQGRSGDR
jgi:hypothetical protein